MQPIYIAFFFVIGTVIAIGVGLELTNGIDEFVIRVLFWMLYIISIITFVNIFLVIMYYLNMKHKVGPVGQQGLPGDRGEKGDTGICDTTCRDTICETQINDLILNELKKKTDSVVKINNVYIKSKVHLMCGSDEFKQLMGNNGPQNLINYIKNVWVTWIDLLYSAGGLKYFETIGAESEFDWLSNNPFDELKQYDVFYWGMGKQYRPYVIEKCYNSKDGVNPDTGDNNYILRASTTNYYDYLGNDEGSGSNNDVSFWRAKQFQWNSNVYYPVGDVAIGPIKDNDNITGNKLVGEFQVQSLTQCPERQTIIVSGDVKGPVDYILIWSNYNNNNSDNANVFWIWRPIPPPEFMALGDVVSFYEGKPNTGDSAPIRCVPKYATSKITPNGNVLWSSIGSPHPTNLLILGYIPNDGEPINANSSNAYNLFRGIIGTNSNIPQSDINANFYSLDNSKYDYQYTIGSSNPNSQYYPDSTLGSNPSEKGSDTKVGKGYLPSHKKDAKYSILSYINLKNNPTLTHIKTNTKFECSLIPNAISNAYLIKINNKCVNYDTTNNNVTYSECDDTIDNQIFSIIMTGDKKHECRIQHYNSKHFITYNNGMVTLIDENNGSYRIERENTLFMMA